MLKIFSQFFDSNQKVIDRLSKVVAEINKREAKYTKLTDKSLKEVGLEFKNLVAKGKDLDSILPNVYGAVREASKRTTQRRLFDVQLMAAITFHQGKIAEQRTGEGKTLSAVPALFLNSLTGSGVHLVTVNDYLAKRDCGWNGPIYHALGASCAVIVHDQAFIFDPKFEDRTHTDKRLWNLKPISRQEAYLADITYGTNNEFGFDYLRDNMVRDLEQKAQRGHHFAIVDEVDSILIDEARTPLIISSPGSEATDKYYSFAKLINGLGGTDYTIDEKQRTAHLTDHGISKVEKILRVENLYEKDFSTLHHLEQALKAKTLFFRDRDYVVKDGEVIIVDEFTGRLMPGRRYGEGLHQAIEAKEGVKIQQESQTMATISFQNYFRMYQKLAGMTGTAVTEAEEFHKIYKLEVIVIPTHMKMIRKDLPDLIYKTQSAKFSAVANLIKELNHKGQPILVGTTSIEKNEHLSALLKKLGIPHALLNAKNHEREAEIIAQAGEKGAVTVATNMAGRGVDIKLAKGVDTLDGLFVIGTERHESRRIDNQLRGRSGRQGDPGMSRFFVSLEDDLMRIFGGDQVAKVMSFLKIPEDQPIEHGMVSKAIESSQVKVEGHNFDARKYTVEYDDVMNKQRQVIYKIRDSVLQAAKTKDNNLKEDLMSRINQEIIDLVTIHTTEGVELDKIISGFTDIIPFDPNSKEEIKLQLQTLTPDKIANFLFEIAKQIYEAREKTLESIREIEVFVYLNTIDTLWVEHLDTIDDLRAGIGLRSFAQREPLVEYKREAFDLFERLVKNINSTIVHQIYKLSPAGPQIKENPIDLSQAVEQHQEALDQEKLVQDLEKQPVISQINGSTKVTIERAGEVISQQEISADGAIHKRKLGRNDPCWCGKTKPDGTPVKYKHCHYPN